MRRHFGLFAVALAVAGVSIASTGATSSPLVGRWQTVRTCQGLVVALEKTGLSHLAPSVVGDYFPEQTPAALAKKRDICSGAKPQLHSHVFTAHAKFGSLDQHGKQVDDGRYQVLTSATVKINDGRFRFRIRGRTLMLTPLLTRAEKRQALANPMNFSTAGWMVAVSYLGHSWRRVPCGQWC
jgi:hypothetical protein